jgi:hypothetical protein
MQIYKVKARGTEVFGDVGFCIAKTVKKIGLK